MEGQIKRYGYERPEAAERARRREPTAETDVCQLEPGTPSAQGYCSKKAVKPDERRELAVYVMEEHDLSERQACKVLKLSRSVFRNQGNKPDDSELQKELLALAARKPRWGYGKMLAYLKRDGHDWNHKRIRRV